MNYLKIDEQKWSDLFQWYLSNLVPKSDKDKAVFSQQMFHRVVDLIEESNGEWGQ